MSTLLGGKPNPSPKKFELHAESIETHSRGMWFVHLDMSMSSLSHSGASLLILSSGPISSTSPSPFCLFSVTAKSVSDCKSYPIFGWGATGPKSGSSSLLSSNFLILEFKSGSKNICKASSVLYERLLLILYILHCSKINK